MSQQALTYAALIDSKGQTQSVWPAAPVLTAAVLTAPVLTAPVLTAPALTAPVLTAARWLCVHLERVVLTSACCIVLLCSCSLLAPPALCSRCSRHQDDRLPVALQAHSLGLQPCVTCFSFCHRWPESQGATPCDHQRSSHFTAHAVIVKWAGRVQASRRAMGPSSSRA